MLLLTDGECSRLGCTVCCTLPYLHLDLTLLTQADGRHAQRTKDFTDRKKSLLQETVVYHDLPSDPLAAWFYKCDQGSGGTDEHDMVKAADNAGEGLALLCCACEGSVLLCCASDALTVLCKFAAAMLCCPSALLIQLLLLLLLLLFCL